MNFSLRGDGDSHWRFHAGAGWHRPFQIVTGPPNLAVLLTHCGQLILRKISKFDATRCQILRLKCTKFDFRWGSVPDPAGGAYSAPQAPLLYLRGLLLGERGGRGRGRGGKRKEEGRGGDSPQNILA